MSVRIPLSQGKFATVDDCDADALLAWKWHANQSGSSPGTFYAAREWKRGRSVLMHRVILGVRE